MIFTYPQSSSFLRKKILTLCVFGICLVSTTIAQVVLQGKINDLNKEPLPFVHIRMEPGNIGTISNESGEYQLVLKNKPDGAIVVFSSLGYKTKRVPAILDYQTITLIEDVSQLPEVVISNVERDYAKELILKAIEQIPNNYPKIEERHTGFFRETTYLEGRERPAYIAEAVIESIKEDYSKSRKSGDVTLKEFRKYEDDLKDSLGMSIYAGSHHIHRFDVVARREAFLSKPDRYTYKITDTLRQNGNEVFEVLFKRKGFTGHIYIMDESFAIVQAEIDQKDDFILPGSGRTHLKIQVYYEQAADGLWRFNNSFYDTSFIRGKGIVNLSSQYVTTDVQPNEEDIAYLDKLQFSEYIIDETKEYDPDFWDNYNIILPDQNSEALFASIDYSDSDTDDDMTNSDSSFLKSLRYEISVGWASIDLASHKINYTNEVIDLQRNAQESIENSVNLNLSIFYELSPHFMLGYSGSGRLTRTGLTSYDLVAAGNFNLNPKGRPIKISPRLNVGYQEINHFIKKYDQNGEVEINDADIDFEKTNVFLSQRGFRLAPSVLFLVESSKRLDFFVSAVYNFNLSRKQGLLFKERFWTSFIPQNVFLEEGDEGLDIDFEKDDLLRNRFSLNAGIAYKF
ncbi:MAG: carboxypeptidase-like regulatory domain-containing protein [Nonlabens sp.]